LSEKFRVDQKEGLQGGGTRKELYLVSPRKDFLVFKNNSRSENLTKFTSREESKGRRVVVRNSRKGQKKKNVRKKKHFQNKGKNEALCGLLGRSKQDVMKKTRGGNKNSVWWTVFHSLQIQRERNDDLSVRIGKLGP